MLELSPISEGETFGEIGVLLGTSFTYLDYFLFTDSSPLPPPLTFSDDISLSLFLSLSLSFPLSLTPIPPYLLPLFLSPSLFRSLTSYLLPC